MNPDDAPAAMMPTSPERTAAASAAPRPCGNCGTTLKGPFCHQCGQPLKSPVRELWSLTRDGISEMLSVDGRFFRSIVPLLFRPGALTRQYLDGRRISFIRPFRLYLGLSILLFLAIALFDDPLGFGGPRASRPPQPPVPANGVPVPVPDIPLAPPVTVQTGADGVQLKGPEVLPGTPPTLGLQRPANGSGFQFTFGGTTWDPRHDPLDIPYVPQWLDQVLREQLVIILRNGREIERDPSKLWRSLVNHLPQALFLLLPLFALLLKLMYVFKKRLYAEHLIVALHSHSFLFLCFLLMIFGNVLAGWWPALDTLAHINWIVLVCWMPIYLLLMQKRVYRQGWIMTLLKYLIIGLIYLVLISLTVAIAFLLALRFMD